MKYTFHPFAKIELNEAVHYYESLAEREAISLAQYIVYTLTRQMSGGYTVRVVPEADVAKQRESFDSLLRNWGRISPAEADRILNGREPAEPEPDLPPEVVSRLKARIARDHPCKTQDVG